MRALIEHHQVGEIDDETRELVEREMPDLVPELPPDPDRIEARSSGLDPGSAEAVARGCICDPGKNDEGRGARNDELQFLVDKRCPLHGAGALKRVEDIAKE